MIQDAEKATKAAEELQSWKALLGGTAWREKLLPKLEDRLQTATEGLKAKKSTPQERAEWIECHTLCEELITLPGKEVARLHNELTAWSKAQDITPTLVSSALG